MQMEESSLDEEKFYLDVANALSGCQLVEQELKLYISEALQLVTKCVGDKLVFKMTGKDYENSSLERLIEIFKKLSNNNSLIKELNEFKKERNFLSHQGIAHCLDWEGDLHYTLAEEFQTRLTTIREESSRLRHAIHAEAGIFKGHLYFGDFSKNA